MLDEGKVKEGLSEPKRGREGKRNPVVKGCAGRSTRGKAYDSPRFSSGVFPPARLGGRNLEARRPGTLVLSKNDEGRNGGRR